jgi:hypothetical protein
MTSSAVLVQSDSATEPCARLGGHAGLHDEAREGDGDEHGAQDAALIQGCLLEDACGARARVFSNLQAARPSENSKRTGYTLGILRLRRCRWTDEAATANAPDISRLRRCCIDRWKRWCTGVMVAGEDLGHAIDHLPRPGNRGLWLLSALRAHTEPP